MDVTVIVTCYNEGEKIKTAIKSLLNQTDQDFELIIVNDASPHEITNAICKEYEREYRVIWHEKNRGLSGARNSGFENAKGDIVIPLDADDELPSTALRDIKEAFRENPYASFAYGNYDIIWVEDGVKETVDMSSVTSKNDLDLAKLILGWKLLGTSPCKRTTWKKIGGYDSMFANTLQDMDFWMRALQAGNRGVFIPRTIYTWKKSKSGMNESVNDIDYLLLTLHNVDFYLDNHPNGFQVIQESVNSINDILISQEQRIELLLNSKSYRVGNFIVSRIKKINQLFEKS